VIASRVQPHGGITPFGSQLNDAFGQTAAQPRPRPSRPRNIRFISEVFWSNRCIITQPTTCSFKRATRIAQSGARGFLANCRGAFSQSPVPPQGWVDACRVSAAVWLARSRSCRLIVVSGGLSLHSGAIERRWNKRENVSKVVAAQRAATRQS
jgi:hypothetical protein